MVRKPLFCFVNLPSSRYLGGGGQVIYMITLNLITILDVIEKEKYKDAKSVFQEKAQEKYGITPTYKIEDSWGPDHEKNFKVGVFLNDNLWAEGQGKSKQKAEQNAAEKALKKIDN